MAEQRNTGIDARRPARQAVTLHARLFRRWLARGLRQLGASLGRLRAESELRAMDEHELRDLGLGRGGIVFAVRHGRERRH